MRSSISPLILALSLVSLGGCAEQPGKKKDDEAETKTVDGKVETKTVDGKTVKTETHTEKTETKK